MPSIAELKSEVKLLLTDSFVDFKKCWLKLIGAGALIGAAAIPVIALEVGLIAMTGAFSGGEMSWVSFVVMPIVFVLHVGLILGIIAMQVGFTRLCLKLVRNEQASIITELKSGFAYFLPMVLASLIVAPAILLGLICLIVPGIYLAMRFAFFSTAVADGYSPVDAVKKSFRLSQGHLLEMLALLALYQVTSFVLAFLPIINIFGIFFCLLPFVHFFWAKYYVTLESKASASPLGMELNAATVRG